MGEERRDQVTAVALVLASGVRGTSVYSQSSDRFSESPVRAIAIVWNGRRYATSHEFMSRQNTVVVRE
jgi:hypothetical protein